MVPQDIQTEVWSTFHRWQSLVTDRERMKAWHAAQRRAVDYLNAKLAA